MHNDSMVNDLGMMGQQVGVKQISGVVKKVSTARPHVK